MKTLFLAAGHGGPDRGNVAVDGVVEAEETIRFLAGVQAWFGLLGVRRGLGGVVCLDDRLDLGGQLLTVARWKPRAEDGDLCIDFHLDYKANKPDGGALVLYDETPYAPVWARAFLQRWCRATGIANNGVHRSSEAARQWRGWDDFGWCRPRWPGVIVELGCVNCARDVELVRMPIFQALAAQIAWEAWQNE